MIEIICPYIASQVIIIITNYTHYIKPETGAENSILTKNKF